MIDKLSKRLQKPLNGLKKDKYIALSSDVKTLINSLLIYMTKILLPYPSF